jgi:hypothetical protein
VHVAVADEAVVVVVVCRKTLNDPVRRRAGWPDAEEVEVVVVVVVVVVATLENDIESEPLLDNLPDNGESGVDCGGDPVTEADASGTGETGRTVETVALRELSTERVIRWTNTKAKEMLQTVLHALCGRSSIVPAWQVSKRATSWQPDGRGLTSKLFSRCIIVSMFVRSVEGCQVRGAYIVLDHVAALTLDNCKYIRIGRQGRTDMDHPHSSISSVSVPLSHFLCKPCPASACIG